MSGPARVQLEDGAWLAVEDSAGAGPPVVLLHGLASTRRWWDLVAARLGGRRVIRWDQRGHGLSGPPSGVYGVDDLARDAAEVLVARRLDGCVVVGHSMGASVALLLAAARPDLVAAVCCVDGGLGDPRVLFGESWPDARAEMRIDRRTMPTAAMLAVWARGNGLPESALAALLANYAPAEDRPGRLRLRLTPEREEALAHSIWRQRPGEPLARLRVPVVAVLARTDSADEVARRELALRVTLAASGRVVSEIWIDGGHELPLEQPGPVAEAIEELAIRTGALA